MSVLIVLALNLVTFIGLMSAVDVICNQNAITNMVKRNSSSDDAHKIQVVTFIDTMDNFTCDQVKLLKFLQMKLHHLQLFDIEYSLVYVNKTHEMNTQILDKLTEIADNKMTVIHLFADNETTTMTKFEEHHVIILDRCGRVTYQILPPWSFVQYPYVKAAILSTYFDDPCGNCTLKSRNDSSEAAFTNSDWENWNDDSKSSLNQSAMLEHNATVETQSSPIQLDILSTKELIFKMAEARNHTVDSSSQAPPQNDASLNYIRLAEAAVTGETNDRNGNQPLIENATTETYYEKNNQTENADENYFFKHYIKLFPWISYDLQ